MNVPGRLAAFIIGLLAAFGAAFGLGRAVGAVDEPEPADTSRVEVDHHSGAADSESDHGAQP